MAATVEEIRTSLKTIIDPEIHINIVDLGLVYGVSKTDDENIKVDMTLTSPMCPFGPELIAKVPKAVEEHHPEIKNTEVNLVWVPPWDPKTMATEEVKMELGIFDDFDDWDDEDEDDDED